MSSIISFALKQRLFVLLLALLLAGVGVNSYKNLPIDAFPNIAPTQVKIIIKSDGLTPTEMESNVLLPIESQMLGIESQTTLRSIAKYGICDITIDFKDGTDIYWARSQVSERLNAIMGELPKNIKGGLAPISTPLSDVLMFSVESPKLSLVEKRTLLDWVIIPQLKTISGVAEVNAMGGGVKTYQVTPDLLKMATFGIDLDELKTTLEANSKNSGLGVIEQGVNSLFLRSIGSLESIDELKNLTINTKDTKPIYLKDIAKVSISMQNRSGFSTKDGKGENVQGIVLSLKDFNTDKLLKDIKARLKAIESNLDGVKLEVFYDRSNLVDLATKTIKNSLVEAVILIAIVLLIFLANITSAISVAIVLPFSLLFSFIAMEYFGISANLMSLGGLAIATGLLVDSAVVMVEYLGSKEDTKLQSIKEAAIHIAPPIVTGVLIIIIVFLPLLSLEGLEGKLFKPVALSIVFALSSSLLLSLTLVPAISSFLLKKHKEPKYIVALRDSFGRFLEFCTKHTLAVLSLTFVLFLSSLFLAYKNGKTFMPTMDEGDIVLLIDALPSIGFSEAIELNTLIQAKLMSEVSEIKSIVARTGTDELGLDPMGLNDSDTFLVLKPKDEWSAKNKDEIIKKLRDSLDEIDGIEYVFSQPIQMRISEMLSGTRGDLSIDIFGEDLYLLDTIAENIKDILQKTQGSSDIYKKAFDGVEYSSVVFDSEALSRYNLSKDELSSFLKTMLSGDEVGIVQEGLRRFDIVLKGDIGSSLSSLKNLNFILKDGSFVPLSQLVKFEQTKGLVAIEHENGYRKATVQTNIDGRDLVSFVDDIKAQIEQNIELPPSYFIEYDGEFKNQQRAAARLMLIVPIAIFLIFILLFISFGSLSQAFLVLINIPLALIGGFSGLYFSGEYMSVPASVGFIALLGIAILNGVVLVNHINYLLAQGNTLYDSVLNGTKQRLRPVIMTATITALSLIPLLLATGVGSEVQKPLAIVVVSGLVSSTALTLVVLPLLFLRFYKTTTKAKL